MPDPLRKVQRTIEFVEGQLAVAAQALTNDPACLTRADPARVRDAVLALCEDLSGVIEDLDDVRFGPSVLKGQQTLPMD